MSLRLRTQALAAALCWLAAFSAAQAQPGLTRAVPGGLPPGKTVEVTLSGDKLAAPLKLWSSFPAKIEQLAVAKDAKSVTCRMTVEAGTAVGVGGLVVANSAGVSDPLLVVLDDLSTVADNGANHSPDKPQLITIPTAVDGRADGVAFDYYRFAAKKGQQISIEVVARRIGSAMDPVLRLSETDGKEIALVDDDLGLGADCRLQHTFEKDGEYLIELRDNRYQAGGAYRLRIGDFPLVSSALPLGGRLGSTTRFQFVGPAADDAEPMILRIPNTAPTGRLGVSVKAAGGVSSAMAVIAASSLPEAIEAEPNNESGQANAITLPCAVSGVLQDKKDFDYFQFAAAKGQRIDADALARSFGSPAFVVLRLQDAAGKLLAESKVDDSEELSLAYTIPADGIYRLSLTDLLHRGGPAFAYRVEVRSGPDFTLVLKHEKTTQLKFATPLNDGAFALVVQCQRRGYDGPITLELENGDGLQLYNRVIPAKANEVRMFVAPPPNFSEGDFRALRVVGRAEINGQTVRRSMHTEPTLRAQLPQLLYPYGWQDGLVTMTTSKPAAAFYGVKSDQKSAEFPRGVGKTQFAFALERKDKEFKAGVNVYPEGLPEGFQAAVKADKDTYTVTISGDKNAPPGEFTLRLISIGEHKGRGQKLVQEIPIRIIDPVAVSIAPPAPLVAGQILRVQVNASRQGGQRQPIQLKLTNLPKGVTTQPSYTIPADQDGIEVELNAAADAQPGVFENLTVEAKTTYQGVEVSSTSKPVRLEVKKAS